ncbi:MAG: beta-N-acetylhexosaminidase [Nitrospirota bacterium]|nr:beta-N-acetylhexosaminidase [Nitrospirota bacterium]
MSTSVPPLPPLSIDRAAGQVLMIGYEEAPDAALDALAAGRAGGIILFSRNVASAGQVRSLTERCRTAFGGPVPIAIDQEGGRVARLAAAGLPAGPPARAVAALGPQAVYDWGRATGRFLRDLGLTIDFAPVLDVDTNPDNPIIGDRAYGRDPDSVIQMARAAIRGLASAGIQPCGKHFPGHGDTLLDSHVDLPWVRHTEPRLEAVELAPFAALAAELPAIMTAHVVYPAWDAAVPATLSRRIVSGILRQQLGFTGIIVSDDLEMAAVARLAPAGELAVRSIEAGVDLLLCCKRQQVWEEAYDALRARAATDAAFRARLLDAAERVRRIWCGHDPQR